MTLKTVALTLLLALSACADPHDYQVPTDSAQWKENAAFKSAVQKLPEDEKTLLLAYLVRAGMAESFGKTLPEITIGDALQNQKDEETFQAELAKDGEAFQAEMGALKAAGEADEEKEHQAALAEAKAALTVTVSNMDVMPSNPREGRFQDSFSLVMTLQNNTEKDMAGVKGTVVFADMFDDVIKRVNLSVDDTIKAGTTLQWSGSLDYNQFMDEDKKLRNTNFAKMKISWEPMTFIFLDGSQMDVR